MVGVTCRCTVAFHWSTVGSRLLKGRDREKTPSGTSGRPLTPTHCALSGVNTPPTTPLGSVMALQLLVASVPPSLVAGSNEGGPWDSAKTPNPVFALRSWLPSTGRF